jgi:hypothetical protein
MASGNKAIRVIGSALLIAAMSSFTFADTIRLKDGSIIKGKITSFGGGEFTVAIGQGTRRREMKFTADEIESIVFDESPQRSVVTASDRDIDDRTTSRVNNDSSRIASNQPVYTPPVATPKTTPQTKPANTTTSKPAANTTAAKPAPVKPSPIGSKPVQLSVKVLADDTANGWTNSGWVVRKGQRIRIVGSGEVNIGHGKTATPSGLYDLKDESKLLKSVPTAALIAVIGDDNNDFIYIGSEREFTAERDGSLFLGLNEGNLNDNSGSFDVKIEILPAGSE